MKKFSWPLLALLAVCLAFCLADCKQNPTNQTPIDPPKITSQPKSQAVMEGAEVSFKVSVENADKVGWFKDGVVMELEGEPTLIIYEATDEEAGEYQAFAENSAGRVFSDKATLTVRYDTQGEGDFVKLPSETLSSGLTAEIVAQSYNDNPYNIGGWTDASVVVDSGRDVHITYRNTDTAIGYAKKVALFEDQWYIKNDWPFGLETNYTHYYIYGGNNCLALDSSDNLYISSSANDGGDEDLIYLTNKSGHWQLYEVDVEGDKSVGLSNSLVVDSNGVAHISYWYWNESDLRYATNESGQWIYSSLDTGNIDPEDQIGIDHQGIIHVVYDDGANKVWLQSKIDGVWSKEQVPIADVPYWDPRRPCSLAFDQADNIYVFGLDGLNIKRGGTWEHQDILGQMFADVPEYHVGITQHDLEVDSQGHCHICFYFQPEEWMDTVGPCGDTCEFYIYYATNASGAWQARPIDHWPVVNCNDVANPRLALDRDDNVHLVYIKNTDWKVRYVTFNPADLLAD